MRGVTAAEGDIDTATPFHVAPDVPTHASHAAYWGVLGAAALGALVPQLWFRAGTFIAMGDTFPELQGLHGITRFWGDDITGTGSTGYPSARLLERTTVQVMDWLGGSAELAQRLWFTLVVAMLAATVAWLASAFVRHPAAVFAAGAIGVLNPYVLVHVPNVQPLIALAAMALLIGIVVRLGKQRHVPALAGLALAVWAAPLARTPPYLLLLVVVGGVSLLGLVLGGVARPTLRLAGIVVVGSAFWAVPFAIHHLLGTPGVHPVVADGPDAFRWAQAHGGPTNVVTLVSWWRWGEPEGGAAVVRLAGVPWSLLRWALPIATVFSIALTWRRRGSQVVGLALFVLIGFAAGANAPFGPVNDFFLDVTKADGVFREPMSKFGVLMVLCVALAIAFGVEDAMERWATRAERPEDGQPLPILVGLCAIAVVFVHPLLTGEVIPGGRGNLPSARVTLPDSWRAAGAVIDGLPGEAATLVLPLSDRYHRGTTWGFYGIDDLVSRLTERPAYELLPGGYQEPDGASPSLMVQAESALANGDRIALTGALRALGARYLAVRTDTTAAVGGDHEFRDGDFLVAAAERMGLRPIGRFQYVQLFELPPAARFAAATRAVTVVASQVGNQDEAVAVAAALADDSTAIAADAPIGTAWVPSPTEEVLAVNLPPGRYTARAVSRGPAMWTATVDGRSVRLAPSDTAEVGGVSLLDDTPVVLRANRAPFALLVGNDPLKGVERLLVPLGATTSVQLVAGAPVSLLTEAPSLVGFDDAAARRCDPDASTPPGAAAPDGSVEGAGDDVTLTSTRGTVCVAETVRVPQSLEGHHRWVLSFAVTTNDPGSASACLYSSATEGCVAGSRVVVNGASRVVTELVDATGDLGDVQLVLRASHTGATESGTEVTFTDVQLSPLQEADDPVIVPAPIRDATSIIATSGRNTVINSRSEVEEMLGAFGAEAFDCARYDDLPADVDVQAPGGDDGISLTANRHSACVAAPITAPAGVRDVTLSFQYRSGTEGVARVALMDSSTGATIDSRRLPASTFWVESELHFTLPAAPVGRDETLQLVLVADGPRAGETARTVDASYRNLRMLPAQPFAYAVLPSAEGTTTVAGAQVVGIDDRFASVRADGQVVLTFQQAYDDGWDLEGLPSGVTARHVRVNGWANGWVIDGLAGRSAVVEVRFRYEWWVAFAVWTAPVVWLLVLLFTEWGRVRRRSVRSAA